MPDETSRDVDQVMIRPLAPDTWPAFADPSAACARPSSTKRHFRSRLLSQVRSLSPDSEKMSSSFLYNGTRKMYEEAGFTYQRSKGQTNCVMTRTISPA